MAFLMVGIRPVDRSFLKLVWDDLDGRRYYSQFCRVPFGIVSGPFLLLTAIHYRLNQLKQDHPHEVEHIKNQLYMDDYVGGCCDDLESAIRMKDFAVSVFKSIGMNLRKFVSVEELHHLLTSDPAPEKVKVLGVEWIPSNDEFRLEISLKGGTTKREISSSIASIFDPLGFVSPVLVPLRIFLQELWKVELKWDDPLPFDLQKQWEKLRKEAEGSFVIPRYVPIKEDSQLFVFCDATLKNYSIVIYVKTEGDVYFLFSKSKVSPLKPKLTLPRLELMANFLGVRCVNYVKNLLGKPDLKTLFWTDSMICLSWIEKGSSGVADIFVSNRVKEIRNLSHLEQWNHVSGKINAADLPSRGCKASDLKGDLLEKWRKGPDFLKSSLDTPLCSMSRFIQPMSVLPIRNYSSFGKVVRIVCWILRWRNKKKGVISLEEQLLAKKILISLAQQNHASEEWEALKEGKCLPATSNLWNVRPTFSVEDNLIIVFLRDASTLIPENSELLPLLITDVHKKMCHLGVSSTVAEIRRSFYVPHLRRHVRKVVGRCNECRRLQSRAFKTEEAPLPSFRIRPSIVFRSTGIDHFGPLNLKDEKQKKAYVLLFSCAVTRAVHLELVPDTTAKETYLAIQRFIDRRGQCKFFISDNASCFKFLRKALSGIHWETIAPTACWWAGFYERCVQTVKRCMKKTLGNTSLNYTELETCLTRLENVINRRPLCRTVDDDQVVLTPAHFILGAEPRSLDTSLYEALEVNVDLERRWKHRQLTTFHLWNRFKKEYLLTLGNWNRKKFKKSPSVPVVGDVVLIGPPDTVKIPRWQWHFGKVVRLIVGRDEEVRAVELKCNHGNIIRPLSRLYPLEAVRDSEKEGVEVRREDELDGSSEKVEGKTDSGGSEKVQGRTTRSGRIVKRVDRLGWEEEKTFQ